MKIVIVILSLTMMTLSAETHRVFGINDTTTYIIENDKFYVTSDKLYYNEELKFDLSLLELSDNYFIADFDIVINDLWYLLVSSRYSSNISFLMKSTDEGNSWKHDTSFYSASSKVSTTEYNNKLINQVYVSQENEILLFIGYYESGIVYSKDNGGSWNLWFNNQQAFYSGILECENDYYLYSFEGDALSANTFKIHSKDFLKHDSGEWFPGGQYHPVCVGQINPECIYAPNNLNQYEQFLIFKSHVNENCGTSSVINTKDSLLSRYYFNKDLLYLDFNSQIDATIKLYSFNGNLILSKDFFRKKDIILNNNLSVGVYFLEIVTKMTVLRKKLLKLE